MKTIALIGLVACIGSCGASQGPADVVGETYAAIPASILTPSAVDTRIGTLRFFDGLPDEPTVDISYDHLDFMRGVRAYLQAVPGAAMMSLREGLFAAGLLPNYTVFVSESLLDSRSQFLTLDTETVYATTWISLKGGPIVVETPPRTLGVLVDSWQRHLADTGYPGPDHGRGGRYVIVPPGYAGYVPPSEFAVRSQTFGVWMLLQGFLVKGRTRSAVDNFQQQLKVYPLKESARPPPNQFVDMSGKDIDTIAPRDLRYFELVDSLVQEEPRESQDPELLGVLASIGIEKERKFAPDARMESILSEAVIVGDATVRAVLFGQRNPAPRLHPQSQWRHGEMAECEDFTEDNIRLLDRRSSYRYYATAHVPVRVDEIFGKRSESAVVFRDREGHMLDGGHMYSMTLPPGIPAKNFWSLVVYDNETRSMLRTKHRFPSLNTTQAVVQDRPALEANEDGSITLYFGPSPPKKSTNGPHGRRRSRTLRSNWIATTPGRGWNATLRLYGALEPWKDGTWRPGEIEPQADVARSSAPTTDLSRTTRSTRVGPLVLEGGVPDDAATARLYENLDFIRGVDAFLNAIPGASVAAIHRGLQAVGIHDANTIGIFERFMDSHALFLTHDAESVYATTWLDLAAGAMVVESPPKVSGIVDDGFFRSVADLGPAGPDKGEGGLFLFTPPRYHGQISERYFGFSSPTFGNVVQWRESPKEGDPQALAARLEQTIQVYPYDFDFDKDFDFEAEPVPAETEPSSDEPPSEGPAFVALSGQPLHAIHANDVSFYSEVDTLIQREPPEAFDPELLGLLASIGIRHGQRFNPSPNLRESLVEAAAVANATARALAFRPRAQGAARYGQDSGWYTGLLGNSSRFLRNGARLLDARTTFFYLATMMSPTMTSDRAGQGVDWALDATDAEGRYLDGGTPYTLTLPASVPAGDFWSLVVYDPQTRSMLQTPRTSRPSVSSRSGTLTVNEDGSTTIYFGPRPPTGREANWIQTVPNKGWFTVLHLYAPLKPWFDRSWRPGNIVRSP